VYIPEHEGYGRRAEEGIPGYSTLIFEIELLGIA
jgi:peptidylprolyl isomerase